jgi:phosphatidate phosphatase APP1
LAEKERKKEMGKIHGIEEYYSWTKIGSELYSIFYVSNARTQLGIFLKKC